MPPLGGRWAGRAMPDRKPEPRESGAVAPFLSIDTEHGTVEVWALGEDRFAVRAPDRRSGRGRGRARLEPRRSELFVGRNPDYGRLSG
jgi:hypothetical protein